jgi:hypothetical protein
MIVTNVRGLEIFEANGGEPQHQRMFLDLYAELFSDYAYYIPYLKERLTRPPDDDPRFIEHRWLVLVDGHPAGFYVFKYMPSRECGLMLGIAVRPEYRKCRGDDNVLVSDALFQLSLQHLKVDARALGHRDPLGMVTELKVPETAPSQEIAQGRVRLIERFRRAGFVDLPVIYHEPPFIEDKRSEYLSDLPEDALKFTPMLLGIFPLETGRFDINDEAQVANCVEAFLIDHYQLPEDHWAVCRALESLSTYYRMPNHE